MNTQPIWLRAHQNKPEPPLFLQGMKYLALMLITVAVTVSAFMWAVKEGWL